MMSASIAPRRIASLLASSTEILYGLGLGDRVVAVSHECDWPADAREKPRVTRTRVAAEAPSAAIDDQVRLMSQAGEALYELDLETLETLAPDLIVTQAQCDVCAVRYADVLDAVTAVPALRGTAVVALNPLGLSDIFADIARVGQAAGAVDAARHFTAALRARVDAVRAVADTIPPDQRPRVALVEWIEPLMLAANWMPELVELAGGRHDLTAAGEHSSYASWDEVRAYDPQVVIVAPCGFDLPRTLQELAPLGQLPGWGELAAVRAGRVFACDGNAYFNRSGPRMIDSLEIVAHLLHPARFAPPGEFAPGAQPWQKLA